MTTLSETLGLNRTMLRKLLVMAVVMFGFGFALVPFYEKICEIAQINSLTTRDANAEKFARNTQVDLSRTITVEFDANSRGPWSFKPKQSSLQVHPGELITVAYDLTNRQARTMSAQAIPSYAPLQSAPYFKKVECFCFKEQTLPAGETRSFPVVFVIDPALPKDVRTITLSYTFFEVPKANVSLTGALAPQTTVGSESPAKQPSVNALRSDLNVDVGPFTVTTRSGA